MTHWKAGSSWIRRILRQVAADRFARSTAGWEPFAEPVPAGAVYSAYATSEQVDAAGLATNRRIIVLRDLRDTLVSAYFSFRDTHRPNDVVIPLRAGLRERSFDDGMIFLMDEFLPRCAAIHRSWADEPIIRYEDLLRDDVAIVRDALIGRLGIDVSEERLEKVVVNSRFRRLTGRPRGEEAAEHLRKGVVGDWRNHFDARIASEFDARFGDLPYPPGSA